MAQANIHKTLFYLEVANTVKSPQLLVAWTIYDWLEHHLQVKKAEKPRFYSIVI